MPPLNPRVERECLLLVDGHAYAYRAFYAIRSLNSPTGEPTNAIYGFIKMLAKMREALQPSHLAVVWDGGLAAERQQLLPDYKAQRPPMPDALDYQINQIQAYLAAGRVCSLCAEGVEADDWLAGIAECAAAENFRVVIASADKDFMQLVSPRIGLLNPNDKSEAIWTAEQVRAKTGVEPEQVVDWLSLIGDSVDNIPGVPGVGPKTATQLLQQFGSIDQLYSRLAEVTSDRLRNNLANAQPVVFRNQRLIRLKRDAGASGRLEDLALKAESAEELLALFTRWGFKSLAAEYANRNSSQSVLL